MQKNIKKRWKKEIDLFDVVIQSAKLYIGIKYKVC